LIAAPYAHFPPKFNLLAVPAAVRLGGRKLAALPGHRHRALLGAVAAGGLILGIAILRADASFAEVGRRGAAELIAPRVLSGQRVWFVGHWGFQWYAERAGARHVTVTPPYPEVGDFIAISRNCDKGVELVPMMLRDFRLSLVDKLSDPAPGGRIMTEGAGFFTSRFGFLPWKWGVAPADEIMVAQVVATRWGAHPSPR
jgi:hypothetical protein